MHEGLEQRKDLQQRLDALQESSPGSPALLGLTRDLETNLAALQDLQAEVEIQRESLDGYSLEAVESTEGDVFVYLAGDQRSAEEFKACRLKFENDVIDPSAIVLVEKNSVSLIRWLVGIIIATMAGAVIIGGIKRIGHVASVLVPFMSVVYVLSALTVIVLSIDQVIPAFKLIFYHAFNPTAVVGGSVGGASLWMTFQWGLRRGLFSNEAGQGSAAMAHSTAKVEEPVREGLVAMLGPFIDTIVICTMTALVIIIMGDWASGETGAVLTMSSFNKALPFYGQWMVVIGVMFFAFSTVVAWSYYGEKGIEYILGDRAKLPYKWVYITFTLLGARFDLHAVWAYADVANGLMAVPNLFALVVLSGAVVTITKKYMDEKKRGIHIPFKQLMAMQAKQQR
jgi:AGCS family alanine or glycine:cation symporter